MRVLLVAPALLFAVLSVADYLTWRSSYRRLTAQAAEARLSRLVPDLDADLRRKANPPRARILLARALVAVEMDNTRLSQLPAPARAEEARRGLLRLELGQRLAEESLARQPASWQAAMVLGASRYLAAERRRDRELPDQAWRAPLAAAMRLAPGQPEPPRVLAAAYLSEWSSLTPAERAEIQPILARAFRDAHSLDLLIGIWSRLAPSLGRLLEPIPDSPWAWKRVEREFLRLGDLERYCLARERWHGSKVADLRERTEQARARLRGGDRRSASQTFRAVVATPPDLAFADSFSTALAMLPHELQDATLRRDLHHWFQWAMDLCLATACPLSSDTLLDLSARLELDGFDAAAAALAAGDLDRARLPDPATPGEDSARWDRLRVLRAEQLIAGELLTDARSELDRVPPERRDDPLFWRAAERLAAKLGDRDARAVARRQLAALARRDWARGEWLRRGQAYRMELLPAAQSPGLRIELEAVPEDGAAVEIRWNGQLRKVVAVQPGAQIRWRFPVTAGFHLLEVAGSAGARVRFGAVALETDRPGR